ncbi:riboflavin biosynthesis protein RibF [Geobacter sp. OR-1]|uniref:bifunctional riboflavin kinase/FAD synthetase n=1 Tax=Geobacter sp. OR-1 TaxID=1266765 RepID=UPI0005431402|nr:bifunctional riboflavin kinase/FAD synthetase [Geobacter sp. OR-1]GAM11510.1 riboflavin biosynthesis protein RibF [Geobacter sp. OR-1]
MEIFRSLEDIPATLGNSVITIGNFDGVHLGHREIFRTVRKAAEQLRAVSVVVTFVPHPLKVVSAPKKQLRLINTYTEKETLIAASGIDCMLAIPFTESFAALSARAFVEDILVKKLSVALLIIGYDYSFGSNRQGNVSTLLELGREFGFKVRVLEPIGHDGLVYSSSKVRELIQEGDVAGVVPLLGRHFSLGGTVVAGHHRGAGIGFPTANIRTEKELVPASGVYAVKVKIDETIYDGACNIGNNPTFDNDESSIEVFLFDFAGDLYGKELRIYFVTRIRDERRFSGIDELKSAISADVSRCREILAATALMEYREYLERG